MIEILVRIAEAADADVVYRFVCLLSEKDFDKRQFTAHYNQNIKNENYIYLVAVYENNVIGFLSCHGQVLLHHNATVYEIQEMYIDEKYRSCGVGKQMLQKLERILRGKDFDVLEVTSNKRREAAHGFYIDNGFDSTHLKFTKKADTISR